MKQFKKLLALVLVGVLCLCCFAACGKTETTPSETPSDNASEATAGTLKIGVIGPLTGGAALYGNAVKYGAELAVKEINAAGGINGMQVEINVQDDTHDAEKSVNAYNTLKDWGMDLLVGTVTSAPCIAVQAVAAEDNMFLLTPSATAVESIASPTAFRICFSDPNQGIASADYIAAKELGSKIGVIYNSQDPYSSGIYAKFASEAEAKGLEIVAAEAFTEDSKQDFSVQLQKMKSAGADLVFLPIYATEAALILSQAASAGLETKFFGCEVVRVSGAVSPKKPTLVPSESSTTLFAAKRSFPVCLSMTLAERKGKFAAFSLAASASRPQSNSWLPTVMSS